jgi:formylglycine-generating enzyme required for sulfatase activity
LNYYYHEGGVVEVGIHPTGASPYGAFDMAGNVWEWTADYYKDNYYANSPSINPLGPEKDTYKETYRVLRGGAWYNDEDEVLVYHREGENPVRARNYQNIGFRCAMSATP